MITRFSGEIETVVWCSDFEHLFFRVDRTIKFIELDDRDKRNCFDFIKLEFPPLEKGDKIVPPLEKGVGGISRLIFDPEKNKLYFLDKADGKNVLREVLLFP